MDGPADSRRPGPRSPSRQGPARRTPRPQAALAGRPARTDTPEPVVTDPPSRLASTTDAWVEVGRVIGAFGVHGAMKVEPWADPAESVLAQVTDWRLVARDGAIVDLVVSALAIRPDALVAEFEPPRTREAILAWKGATLTVPRSAFPVLDDDEYYWSDLVGCAVVNRQGQALGTVTAVLDLGADPLLQVDSRLLIPFVDAHVGTVDVAARRIVVDWSEDWS